MLQHGTFKKRQFWRGFCCRKISKWIQIRERIASYVEEAASTHSGTIFFFLNPFTNFPTAKTPPKIGDFVCLLNVLRV